MDPYKDEFSLQGQTGSDGVELEILECKHAFFLWIYSLSVPSPPQKFNWGICHRGKQHSIHPFLLYILPYIGPGLQEIAPKFQKFSGGGPPDPHQWEGG